MRQVRISSLALLGVLPATVGAHTLAPLIVAIIEAIYAADLAKYVKHDYIEWLTPRDVKIDETDKPQMDRLRFALAGLQYFHHDCQPVLRHASRYDRIQFLGQTDVLIARAFLLKDEVASVEQICGEQLKLLREKVSSWSCEESLPAPHKWFDASRVAASQQDCSSAGPQPILIQYDESGNALSDQVTEKVSAGESEVVSLSFVSKEVVRDLRWRLGMVVALNIVQEWATRACGVSDDTIAVQRDSLKVKVISKKSWAPHTLFLVPLVDNTPYIQLQKTQKALSKVGTVVLARLRRRAS